MGFKPLRKRLEEISKKVNLRLDVVQQDYVLSWLLVGIFQHSELRSNLIFKGGTALKKGYFGEYRFSEDLDFSTNKDTSDNFTQSITEACNSAEKQMREYAPIRLFVKKYEEKNPHPEGQQAFTINAQFPWQSQPLTKVMIEISCNEKVLIQPVIKPLLHPYGEPIELSMQLYSLEEIIIEKLRAILQHTKKLHERAWSRSRVRDYYDLWSILKMFGFLLNINLVRSLLPLKCSHKGVSFEGINDFFDEKMILEVKKTWVQWLGPLVFDLPACEQVLHQLKDQIAPLIHFTNPLFALAELMQNSRLKNRDLYQICERVLQSGADVNQSNEGLSPFQLAVLRKDKDLADLILSYGGKKIPPPGLGYMNHYDLYKE